MTSNNYIMEYNLFMRDEIRSENVHMVNAMESEFAFIMNCLENSYIALEADETNIVNDKKKKTSKFKIFTRLIETIKRVFNNFIEKAKELLTSDKSWIENVLPKLDDINFDGLKLKALPYWMADNKFTLDIINKMVNKLTSIKEDPGNDKKYPSSEEIIEKEDPFSMFSHKSVGFTQMCKNIFSFNKQVPPEKIDGYEGVSIEDGALIKKRCETMKEYIKGYSSYVDSLNAIRKKLVTDLERTENDIKRIEAKRAATKECSIYLYLEEAYLCDTELRYCRNYSSLLEAEQPAEKKEQSTNSVVSTEPKGEEAGSGAEEKSENVDYIKYKQAMAQLVINALTAAITVAEAKYFAYKKIINQIISVKKPKEE